MEEEERQGSRSSQDKDTAEEVEEKVEEDRDEAGGSKVKKTQAKHDHVELGKPKQDNNEPGETCTDETAPREAMDDSVNKEMRRRRLMPNNQKTGIQGMELKWKRRKIKSKKQQQREKFPEPETLFIEIVLNV